MKKKNNPNKVNPPNALYSPVNPEFNLEESLTDYFENIRTQSYIADIVGLIVDDLIMEFVHDYKTLTIPRKEHKLNKIIMNNIIETLSSYLFNHLNKNNSKEIFKSLNTHYNVYRIGSKKGIDDVYKHLFAYDLQGHLTLIKKFGLLWITSNPDKKILMQKLQITFTNYLPTGRKVDKERDIIYLNIPFTKEKLEAEFGKNKRGKSDEKTAVFSTIKILKKKGSIRKYHNPKMIYTNWKKVKENYVEKYKNIKKQLFI